MVAQLQRWLVVEMRRCAPMLVTTTATLHTTTATCCGVLARATDGKHGSWGGRRALVARLCRRPASTDEDERLR